MKRREFLAATAVTAGLAFATSVSRADCGSCGTFKTKPKKALIGNPSRATMERWKSLGFDGMEGLSKGMTVQAGEAAKKLADELQFPVHSTLFGWSNVNTKDEADFQKQVDEVALAIEATAACGSSAILWVPCRIGGTMPKCWEFDFDFDEKTNLIKSVVKGDNAPYEGYIKDHNFAMEMTRRALDKLIPVAEKNKLIIAVENVWNNMWVKPDLFGNFIHSYDDCPWVKCYFDIGNHVKYAKPEDWFAALGKSIVKLHVKDYKLGEPNTDPGFGGFVAIRQGSVNWPAVRACIEKIGYNDFMTIEGGGVSEEEQSKRLDLILAGK